MKRLIAEGEIVPHGWGIAWREWDRDVAVAYPIPLHILLGWLRRAYIWIRFQSTPYGLDRRVRMLMRRASREAYARGAKDAFQKRDGFRIGWDAAFAKMVQDLENGLLR